MAVKADFFGLDNGFKPLHQLLYILLIERAETVNDVDNICLALFLYLIKSLIKLRPSVF